MSITVACICGQEAVVGDEFAGRKAKCRNCGGVLVVPGAPVVVATSSIDTSARLAPSSPKWRAGANHFFAEIIGLSVGLVAIAGVALLGVGAWGLGSVATSETASFDVAMARSVATARLASGASLLVSAVVLAAMRSVILLLVEIRDELQSR